MHQIMVQPLPSGCRLTAIFDASSSLFYRFIINILELILGKKNSLVTPALHWVSFTVITSNYGITNLFMWCL